jgi:predicted GTPase
MSKRERVLILGAAGRDFHNFNMYYRKNESYEVVGFTACQIPGIEGRLYPPVLSGPLYPKGLQIWPESDMEKIVKQQKVNTCVLSYSDLSHKTVMEVYARVSSCGANFEILGYKHTQVKSKKPVVAVTAVRTGCGKSQTSRYVVETMKKAGLKTVVVRHPMPYGDLSKQIWQRFQTLADLDKHHVTIEEREEYEQHIKRDTIVFAGVDYEKILEEAEKEADVVLWDGGNNDMPFFAPDLWICVADPFRPGHEVSYYPGETNFRCADVIIVNKANTAEKKNFESICENAKKVNPKAALIITDSVVAVDHPELIKGKVVLAVDDGPTMTHGEMSYGAAYVAAQANGAKEIVKPRKYAKGSLIGVFEKYKHVEKVLPAMGYSDQQCKDLEETIAAVPCDTVVSGTPMDLTLVIKIKQPLCVATYSVQDREGQPKLSVILNEKIVPLAKK